jgi:hypothetical protein
MTMGIERIGWLVAITGAACGDERGSGDVFGEATGSTDDADDAPDGDAPDDDADGTVADATAASDDADEGIFDVGNDTGGPDPGGPATCEDAVELATNLGCEFWAVDLPNVNDLPPLVLPVTPQNQQFAIVVANTAEVAVHVSIFFGAVEIPTMEADVEPGSTHTFEMPDQSIAAGVTSADGTAWRIESDLPITAYQFNPLDNTMPVYSNDASLLFPVHTLADDYYAVTGDATLVALDAFNYSAKNTGGFVSIVALEDGTEVDVYPTAPLYAGPTTDVLLDRGQVLTAIASELREAGNLSGTRVVASAAVAVFSGSVATSEPTDTDACCADHVEHQMPPLQAWGTTYAVVPPPAASGGDDVESVVRLIGGFDGTMLAYEPSAPAGAPTVLDSGETVAVRTAQPFIVSTVDDTQSLAVVQFLLSNQNFGLSHGDPSMIVTPAMQQFRERYVFLAPSGYATDWVTIVAPADADVELDGVAIAVAGWASVGDVDGVAWVYGHVPLEDGEHVVDASAPIGIVVVGYDSDVSYGYPGGSGLLPIAEPPPPPG